ncbi:ATP-binding protein [Pilimelia anulata]|uniref:ATP-binding protein n=1 Tax=Pilimelia anulata TaxID=53371 RepID=A0A8J3B9C4_9ACTN|nr:tetratricopeptide repeat protein [Pilimelia anulata]GGK04897.1 ATP-binding protein [Pilimelia anulata]
MAAEPAPDEPIAADLVRPLLDHLAAARREGVAVWQGVQIGNENIQINAHHHPPRRPAALPYLVGVLPDEPPGYQERPQAARLRAALAGGGPAGPEPGLVTGPGGVGKTQLAARYAAAEWAAGRLDVLVWASGPDSGSVRSAFAAGSAVDPGDESETLDQRARRFLSWLGTTDKRWLVVIDDLRSATELRGLWPPRRPGGRTIITTRRRDIGPMMEWDSIELAVFAPAEADQYLARRLPAALRDDPAGLAADLGYLPIALSQATALMRVRRWSCTGYRRRFAAARELGDVFPDEGSDFNRAALANTATVAATWRLSVRAADADRPRGLATPLLEVASLLDPNGTPELIFTSAAARSAVADRAGAAAVTADDAMDGLAVLHRYSLLDHEGGLVRVHALVQRATRDRTPAGARDPLARAVGDALREVWPPTERAPALTQRLRSGAQALYRHARGALWAGSHPPHPVLERAVASFGEAVLWDDAIALAADLVAEAGARLGPRHPVTLRLRSTQAVLRGDAEQREAALAEFTAVVADCVEVLGPADPLTVAARHGLGNQHGQAGRPARAAENLAEVLQARIAALGAGDPATVQTADTLGFWLGKAGRYAESVALLSEYLPVAEAALGPDNRQVLAMRANLAFQIGGAGDPAAAVTAFRTTLVEQVRVLGPGHRDISVTRNNLAYWQGEAGDPASSRAALEELLDERIRMYGRRHRDTFATQQGIAQRSYELGDLARARELLEELLPERADVLGYDHHETMNTRYTLACVRGAQGEPAAAAADLAALRDDQLRVLGADHPSLAETEAALRRYTPPPAG